MARLVTARCPQCGAAVKLDPQADYVTCTYCHTSSFIEKPTRAAAAPAPPPHYPTIKLKRSAGALLGVFIALGGVALAVVGAVVAGAAALGSASSTLGKAKASVEQVANLARRITIVGAPLLGDVNQDGVQDIVVLTQSSGAKTVRHISAIDAVTGKYLWTSADLGDSGEQFAFSVAGRLLLIAKLNTLSALNLKDGQQAWRAALPERGARFCEYPKTGAAIVTSDEQMHAINLTNGALTPLGKARADTLPERQKRARAAKPATELLCLPLSGDVYQGYGAGVHELRGGRWDPDVEGMHVDKVLRLREENAYALLGWKQPGTRVPMAAVHTAEALLWKAQIPASDPLAAKEGTPTAATLSNSTLFLAYEREAEKKLLVTSFDLTSGKRRWDSAIPSDNRAFAAVAASDTHVFVRVLWSIYILSARDGTLLQSVGG